MRASNWIKLSPQNFKWLYRFSDDTLNLWKFKPSQIDSIKSYNINNITTGEIPISFLESEEYKNSGLHYLYASRRQTPPFGISINQPTIFHDIYTAHFNNNNILSEDPEEIESNEDPEESNQISTSPIIIESAHDLQVKYLNTYGLKDNIPIYIEYIESDNKESLHTIKYHSIDNKGMFSCSKISYNIGEFDMTLPKVGMINTDKVVVLIERNHKRSSPARYRKAIRSDVISIISISNSSIKELGIPDLYDIYEYGNESVFRLLSHDLFSPKRFTYEEALNKVLSGEKISCAFSQSYAINACFITNKIYLYKNQWIIGTYSLKKNLFILNNNYFLSELNKLGVSYE